MVMHHLLSSLIMGVTYLHFAIGDNLSFLRLYTHWGFAYSRWLSGVSWRNSDIDAAVRNPIFVLTLSPSNPSYTGFITVSHYLQRTTPLPNPTFLPNSDQSG